MNASAETSAAAPPLRFALAERGNLWPRVNALWEMLRSCDVCPRDCKVDRLAGEIAACFAAELPVVSSHVAHFGEEPCLTGTHGAGNVFLGLCNLRCVYCQNFQISQNYKSERRNEVSFERLVEMMLELQERGCHSVAFVSPTHFMPQVARAVAMAHERGLRLPIVYNTNAYDALPALRLLEGIVDIYLPDLKYATDEAGRKYSYVRGYATHARAAIKEMWRQVGPLRLDERGIARGGLIVRHLVMPNDVADSFDCLEWLRDEIGTEVTLSLMAQYYPTNKAERDVLINRKITLREYERVVERAERMGFENVMLQEHHRAADFYRPDFSRDHPFHWGETAARMQGEA